MVDADVVEVMTALPGQLFFNTHIPACLWFLAKGKRVRRGEVLFIDARKLVWCCMLDGTFETDGFLVRARRKPQRYPQVSRGFGTRPWPKRRGFKCRTACKTTLAVMISRVQCELTNEVIERIAGTVGAWRVELLPRPLGEGGGEGEGDATPQFQDIPGCCRSVKLAEIAEHGLC